MHSSPLTSWTRVAMWKEKELHTVRELMLPASLVAWVRAGWLPLCQRENSKLVYILNYCWTSSSFSSSCSCECGCNCCHLLEDTGCDHLFASHWQTKRKIDTKWSYVCLSVFLCVCLFHCLWLLMSVCVTSFRVDNCFPLNVFSSATDLMKIIW